MKNLEYRVVRKKVFKNTWVYQIKEIYYDENDDVVGYDNAPSPYGNSLEEVTTRLKLMCDALEKPTLDYEKIVEIDS